MIRYPPNLRGPLTDGWTVTAPELSSGMDGTRSAGWGTFRALQVALVIEWAALALKW